jgi:hypothetical protein
LREKVLLLFDNRKMPIEFTGLLESAARGQALPNVVEQSSLLGLVAMNRQAEYAEARIVQTATDNFKSSELLGDKKHGLAARKSCSNQVRDGL